MHASAAPRSPLQWKFGSAAYHQVPKIYKNCNAQLCRKAGNNLFISSILANPSKALRLRRFYCNRTDLFKRIFTPIWEILWCQARSRLEPSREFLNHWSIVEMTRSCPFSASLGWSEGGVEGLSRVLVSGIGACFWPHGPFIHISPDVLGRHGLLRV